MTETNMLIIVVYGLIGLTGALSAVIFVWGFITYIMRLGQVRREDGIHIMEWGVGLIITAIVLIGILHLIQRWFGVA
jgi:O-antigen/teichoic acid export membrane protein